MKKNRQQQNTVWVTKAFISWIENESGTFLDINPKNFCKQGFINEADCLII